MLRQFFIVIVSIFAVFGLYEDECGTGPQVCDSNVKIRSYDGSCNNLKHPKCGSMKYHYQRLLPAVYDDGIFTYRKAKSGNPLPKSRFISSQLYFDKDVLHPNLTMNIIGAGVTFVNDMGGRMLNFQRGTSCCTPYLVYNTTNDLKTCPDIEIPSNDPYYSPLGVECFPFIRTETNLNNNCSTSIKVAQQLNKYSAHFDMHQLYGTSGNENVQVRQLEGGRLKTETINNQDYFPKSQNPVQECQGFTNLFGASGQCYKAGDTRNSLTFHVAHFNVITLREHNRIATELSKINPHWNDEEIFQAARTVMIGVYQHICFKELISAFLGEAILYRNGLLHNTTKFIDEYDEEADCGSIQEFIHASFRQPHSMVNGPIYLADEKRHCTGSVNFDDHYNDVTILEESDNFDYFTRGLSSQLSWESDRYHGNSTIHNLFKHVYRYGMDTKSFDIERGRDHGLAPYNDYRVLCGLPRAKSFSDFADVMDRKSIQLLSKIYEHPDDVDFVVGGGLENNLPDAASGHTFSCVFVKQIKQIRKSDRFFYDHRDGPFTLSQLKEVRKGTYSRWLCDNSLNVTSMQPNAFRKISPSNKLVPCSSIPTIDLTKWKVSA